MQENFKLQINTMTDKANFVLYGAANAALCVAVEQFLDIPKLMGAAFVASSAFSYMAINGHTEIMKRNFPPTPMADLPPASEELSEITGRLSKKFRLYPSSSIHVIKERVFIEDGEGFRVGTLDPESQIISGRQSKQARAENCCGI